MRIFSKKSGSSCPSPFCARLMLLIPPLLLSVAVDRGETAGQFTRVKLEKDTEKPASIICNQGSECVSGSEFCDISNLGSGYLQKCGPFNKLSKSVCCPVDKVVRTATKRDRRAPVDGMDDDDVSELDKVLDKAALEPIKPLPDEPECGQNTKSVSKNTTVQNAIASDWPWMAVFLETFHYLNFCDGTLINRRFVLTAAHCFSEHTENDIIVRLGEYDFSEDDANETQFIDFKALEIRTHPYYDSVTFVNDISIVKLNKPVVYNSFIRPICLPKPNMEVYKRSAVVAGWGRKKFLGDLSDVLLEVAIPVWEHDNCVQALAQSIFRTNLCAAAYEGGKDSCDGDSGGPLLMQRQDGRWTNVGVVSWGLGCGEPGYPGVYTRVTSYLKWIAVNAQDVI